MQTERRSFPEPTAPELDVLKILWRGGRRSAREVHEELAAVYSWAYSTTRTTLERMVAKGLVAKAAFHGLYLYEAKVSRPLGLAGLVQDFARRVLEADWAPVVSLFAESEALTAEEIEELRRLLAAEEG